MKQRLDIRPLRPVDIAHVTAWARAEGFAPGQGDVAIYRHTDRQGLWLGWLGEEPIGCIAGVRYNCAYGFIGLFLVRPAWRGQGYGLQLWRHAMHHLADVPCIGLEAATDRIADYAGWGFHAASPTSRWSLLSAGQPKPSARWRQGTGAALALVGADAVHDAAVVAYDARHAPSPRPHFLRDWLHHPAGTVRALIDGQGCCHGFGRIRPCLLPTSEGWRVGPLIADTPALAEGLLRGLLLEHPGQVLIDAPQVNAAAAQLLAGLGFDRVGQTLRMYRGPRPQLPLEEVFGLACLELG
ncbi:GNAT family N-acetyltransferase [Synechococcus sp. CCY9201]|jgi:ribosomal-protein-alanine N-acetyltransferase|uniref:GNAT family N-acetyltransferase n=1 Tax=unclassified Synechococcus TaxID=2626047 RepID=UPI0018CE0C93|nr:MULTISPECIES: GNAT family N-acetyltransferase [unclassified Synechococcus]MEA5422817.1 GNAT family N-acetyltransferase [Synechococcus sp. CCY9202]MEA5475273.1 GNAT family N-acetyltransferase [Synechococcus sp. CCY9201]QPN58698.1 GNAT family N-acetyltransferase [Synechococcus sp. CBW1002]CAK6699426.1 hypothetical protein IFHNHDMJ_02633 [Synechococcus sp. CBW1107]